MAINLSKGQKIDLSKDGKQLQRLLVGLGWKPVQKSNGGFLGGLFKAAPADVDIDASVIMLNAQGKLVNKNDIIYFGNTKHYSGSILHYGDNLVGGTMGGMQDSEQIEVLLDRIPQDVHKLVFVVNIYDCVARKQHFGMVKDAYIRIVDKTDNQELAAFNLTDDYNGKTTLIVGEIYRKDGKWKFNAVGQGSYEPGLGEIVRNYA